MIILLDCLVNMSFAQQPGSIGQLADSMMEPVSVLFKFVATTSLIIGASFLFAAFVRYMQYRVNPLATPISTVIILFFLGALLIALPLAYKLTGTNITF